MCSFDVDSDACSALVDGKYDDSSVYADTEGNLIAFEKTYNMLLENYGTGDGKFSSAVRNYLKTVCGVTDNQINSIKTNLRIKKKSA